MSLRNPTCGCDVPLGPCLGFLFKRWQNTLSFSSGAAPPPPDLTLPPGDPDWTQPPCGLTYTNFHVSESGYFKLGARVYKPDGSFYYEAPAPAFTNEVMDAEWVCVDDSGNLYAFEHSANIISSTHFDVYVWKYDAVAESASIIATVSHPVRKWSVDLGTIGGAFLNKPTPSLCDVRFGRIVYASVGGALFEPNEATRFDGNSRITVLDTDGTYLAAHDYMPNRLVIDDYEERAVAFGTGKYPLPIKAMESRPFHLRIGQDRGVYVSTFPSRPDRAWLRSWPGVSFPDPITYFTSRYGTDATLTGLWKLCDDVNPEGGSPPWLETPRVYGRWWGEAPGDVLTLGRCGHFDVDADGNVVVAVSCWHPVRQRPVTALVRLTPTDDPNDAHDDATASHFWAVGDMPWWEVAGDKVGYYAVGYTEEWGVYDTVLAWDEAWPIHDFGGKRDDGTPDGAWYLDRECVRHTDGDVAPDRSFKWGRRPQCRTRSPHVMRRADYPAEVADVGAPHTAREAYGDSLYHGLAREPSASCPGCDEGDEGVTLCCPGNTLPCRLAVDVLVAPGTVATVAYLDGCDSPCDGDGGGMFPPGDSCQTFGRSSGGYGGEWSIGPWHGWLVITGCIGCDTAFVPLALACLQVPGTEDTAWMISADGGHTWHLPVGTPSCDPFGLQFSAVPAGDRTLNFAVHAAETAVYENWPPALTLDLADSSGGPPDNVHLPIELRLIDSPTEVTDPALYLGVLDVDPFYGFPGGTRRYFVYVTCGTDYATGEPRPVLNLRDLATGSVAAYSVSRMVCDPPDWVFEDVAITDSGDRTVTFPLAVTL